MSKWTIRFHRQALKDVELCKRAGLADKVKALVTILQVDPWQNPPPFEKLVGDLSGMYSRRLNRQHRLVYTVDEASMTVSILALWTHYERGL